MEKITYVAALSTAIATLSADPAMTEVVEKLTALKDQTEKRSNAVRKPSKAQVEKATANQALAAQLFDVLANWGNPVTVAEIKTLDNAFAELSSPKLTALLKILVAERKVAKDDTGRVAKYTALA